jgi:hypothetical protein
VTLSVRLPLPPGLEIVMLGLPAENIKSAFTVRTIGDAEDAT